MAAAHTQTSASDRRGGLRQNNDEDLHQDR